MKTTRFNRFSSIFCLSVCIGTALPGYSQVDRNETLVRSALRGLEYEIKAGFNIGGTAPLPLPVEIRSVDGYNPTLAISIGGEITKWFAVRDKLGVTVGLRLENKAMTTKATVKNYGMEILGQGGERVSGMWTGGVKTKVHTAGLTVPLTAAYKISGRWHIKAGPYFSYLLSKEFSGHVYEGYLREDDPTGPKAEFTDGKIATYDFSGDLRRFQWGLQAGAEWRAFKHLNIYADLAWGLNDIFKKDFRTISFSMYPIYLNIGFGYVF